MKVDIVGLGGGVYNAFKVVCNQGCLMLVDFLDMPIEQNNGKDVSLIYPEQVWIKGMARLTLLRNGKRELENELVSDLSYMSGSFTVFLKQVILDENGNVRLVSKEYKTDGLSEIINFEMVDDSGGEEQISYDECCNALSNIGMEVKEKTDYETLFDGYGCEISYLHIPVDYRKCFSEHFSLRHLFWQGNIDIARIVMKYMRYDDETINNLIDQWEKHGFREEKTDNQ